MLNTIIRLIITSIMQSCVFPSVEVSSCWWITVVCRISSWMTESVLSLSVVWGDALISYIHQTASQMTLSNPKMPFHPSTTKHMRPGPHLGWAWWGVMWRSAESGCWWLLHSRCWGSQTSPVPSLKLQKKTLSRTDRRHRKTNHDRKLTLRKNI